MNSETRDELDNPADWEFDESAGAPRAQRARAVVSVAFAREDFEEVERYARQHGFKVSEFIRLATLDRVHGKQVQTQGSVSAGGSTQMTAYFDAVPASTRAGAAEILEDPTIA